MSIRNRRRGLFGPPPPEYDPEWENRLRLAVDALTVGAIQARSPLAHIDDSPTEGSVSIGIGGNTDGLVLADPGDDGRIITIGFDGVGSGGYDMRDLTFPDNAHSLTVTGMSGATPGQLQVRLSYDNMNSWESLGESLDNLDMLAMFDDSQNAHYSIQFASLSGAVLSAAKYQNITNNDTGVLITARNVLNVVSPLAAADDAGNGWSDLTLAGLSSIGTATYMLRVNAAGTAWEYRSPANVLSDIGAAASSHTHAVTGITPVATDRLLGRDTAGSGACEELTVGGGLEFTGSGGIQRSALTGDVTASAGSGALTIANDAVTYAKMQNVSATDKLLGRSTAGAGDVEEIACTAAGRALLDDASASAQRTTLGLVIGTDVQAYDAGLLSLAALPTAADRIAYSTAADTWAETALTSFGRSLIDDVDAATGRNTLGASSGIWPLALGGTAADLSATGGTGQFLRQSSAGAAITVSAIGHADLGSGGGTGSKYLCDNMTWESAAGMLSDLGAVSGRGNGAANRLAYWSDADTLTSDGDLLFDGANMALGLAIDSNIRLAVDGSPVDPSAAPTSLRVTAGPTYTAHTAHVLRGLYGYLTIASAYNYTAGSLSSGIYGQFNYAAAAGTYTIAAGMYGIASHNGAGTVTTIIGLAGQLQHLSTGGGTNAYAMWAGTPSASGSGTYTQGVGLHVADQSVARYTTSHAIRVADQGSGAGTTWALGIVGTDDQSYIAGSLMIGVASAPARKLHIISTSAQMRLGYDAGNYVEFALESTGLTAGTTKSTPGTVDKWLRVVSEDGTYYIPCYSSTTS